MSVLARSLLILAGLLALAVAVGALFFAPDVHPAARAIGVLLTALAAVGHFALATSKDA